MSKQIFYTIPEAAVLLRVSRATVRKMIRKGMLPGIRVGERRIVVPATIIERLAKVGAEQNLHSTMDRVVMRK